MNTVDSNQLKDPIFIAAWPGMGHVSITACYYLISKLKMQFRAEYAASELFDADHVSIESGLVQPFRYPKNQVFSWRNPDGDHDLLVFIGEAQPPHGRYDFCRKLIDYAQRENAHSIFTFAAMASNSELTDDPRVVGAATDQNTLDQLIDHQIPLLNAGHISGMNGILLGVAAERHLRGGCLLGELPGVFVNVPYPKASVSVLKAISKLTDIEIDLTELLAESDRMEAHLEQAMDQLRRLENKMQDPEQAPEFGTEEYDNEFRPHPADNDTLSPEDQATIEHLFEQAKTDRSKAFELKRELDQLDVFREYEDRFLDLFRNEDN